MGELGVSKLYIVDVYIYVLVIYISMNPETVTKNDIVRALIGIAILMLGFIGMFYGYNMLQKDTISIQLSQANDFANKTITPNMSTSEKIIISQSACDMYYIYSDKNVCYEYVIKEHV